MRATDQRVRKGQTPETPDSGPARQRRWAGHALIGLLCLVLLGLIGRLVYIHTSMRPKLQGWSERRQCSTVPLPGRRGAILDCRYRVLAGSHDRPTVYADPRNIDDREAAARRLAMVVDKPADEIRRLLDHPASPGFVVIQRALGRSQAEGVRALEIPGVALRNEPTRNYPMGTCAAHVLGFVGADGHGLEGVELVMDAPLQARPGKRVVYRDVRRRALFQRPDGYVAPQDGLHVVLTIDAAIQETLETQISRAVEHFHAECGVGLVMSPKTGAVLAMACFPTFDPASAGKVKPELRRNRILTDPMEPGSVFKPFVMSAALAERLTHPTETIFCHNGLYVTGKRRLNDHHPYGHLSVVQILTKSSNIGMAILGQRLGNARMHAALEKFGFGRVTGIDLPGEGCGLLMPLKAWNSFSTTSVPMGQELAVTPIQLATAFSALVNGGRLVRPHVIAAVLDRKGEELEDRRKHEDRGTAIDPAVAAIMRDILVEVVNTGTGRPARLDHWQVLGKTGTAQVPYRHRRGYEPDSYLGSFMAAAPAHDPAVMALIMIRKPKRSIGYYGSKVAAPGVKAVLAQALPYLNIPPDQPAGEESSLAWDRRP